MYEVAILNRFFGAGDMDDLTFARVEHLIPGSFPMLERLQVGLENLTILYDRHCQVYGRVISKLPSLGLNICGQVIYVQ